MTKALKFCPICKSKVNNNCCSEMIIHYYWWDKDNTFEVWTRIEADNFILYFIGSETLIRSLDHKIRFTFPYIINLLDPNWKNKIQSLLLFA